MSSVSTAFKVYYNQKLGGTHTAILGECTVASGGIDAPGQAINPGRPIILCRLSTGMEQSAVSRTGCIVAHHLPTKTENISFSLEFSGPLVANWGLVAVSSYVICRYLIDCVKCPCRVLRDSVI